MDSLWFSWEFRLYCVCVCVCGCVMIVLLLLFFCLFSMFFENKRERKRIIIKDFCIFPFYVIVFLSVYEFLFFYSIFQIYFYLSINVFSNPLFIYLWSLFFLQIYISIYLYLYKYLSIYSSLSIYVYFFICFIISWLLNSVSKDF